MTHPESHNPTARPRRVLDDGTAVWPLWFEISPDRFVNGENRETVQHMLSDNNPQVMGWSLATLRRWYPHLADASTTITDQVASAA